MVLKCYVIIFLSFVAGSQSKEDICNKAAREARDKSTCLKHLFDQGSLYRGNLNITRSGKSCLRWKKPKNANALVVVELPNGKKVKKGTNFCRNGGVGTKGEIPKRRKPWCFVQGRKWEYCDVPLCDTPAPLRKCSIKKTFENNPLYTSFVFDLDGESCIMKDQGYHAEVQKTKNILTSPWDDCGYTYRGQVDKTKDEIKCQRWDSSKPHLPTFEVNARGNYCTLPDLNSVPGKALQCDSNNTPWCYTMDPSTRYQQCSIKPCQCGKTGLSWVDISDDNMPKFSIPGNLMYLSKDAEASKFAELIPFWNANIPCDKSVCKSMFKESSRQARSTRYGNYGGSDDSNSDFSEYDTDPCQESSDNRPECNKDCPEKYDEYNETCDKKTLQSRTDSTIAMRVINGATYVAGTTPWLVALEYNPDPKNEVKLDNCRKRWAQFCGGTLIHSQWVVTAAHCFAGDMLENPKSVTIVAGKSDLDGDEFDANNVHCASQKIPAAMIIRHKEWNGNAALGNDIALIRASDPFWINSMVNYMCLPPPGWKPLDRATCFISGWGLQDGKKDTDERTKRNSLVTRKKYADSRIGLVRHVEKDECEGALWKAGNTLERNAKPWDERTKINPDKQLCFGHKRMDTCQGDSGGPMICKAPDSDADHEFYLAGVVSYGIETLRTTTNKDGSSTKTVLNCGTHNVPGIYTKVSAFIDWIYETMDANT